MTLEGKIGIVTGTRADYGLFEPLISKLSGNSKFKLQLYVTATHLSDFYGHTVDEIKYPITAKVDMRINESNTKEDMGHSVSAGIDGFLSAFSQNRPDIVVVLGDRIEQFAAAVAAMFLEIPIAHIHGGDVSGGIDDSLRSMISRMAAIHFPVSRLSAMRLMALGEEEWRIHVVGAPGLDSILSQKLSTREDLSKKYCLDLEKDWALVVYHPDTLVLDASRREMAAIMGSVAKMDLEKIVVYPNSDAGSASVICEIRKFEGKPGFKVFRNISHEDFISILSHCSFMVGNSSSGILEAPSLGIPAINVGSRQEGRERGANTIDVEKATESNLSKAMLKALHDESFISKVKKKESPYGDGHSSNKTVKILEEMDIDIIKQKKMIKL